MGESAGALALGTNIGASYKSNQEQDIANRKLASAQKKANLVEKRLSEVRNAREIEKAANQARTNSAQNIAAQASSGVSNSSALSGTLASSQAALSGKIGFSNTLLAGNAAKNYYLQRGRDQYNAHMNKANNWQAVGNLSSQAASVFTPT